MGAADADRSATAQPPDLHRLRTGYAPVKVWRSAPFKQVFSVCHAMTYGRNGPGQPARIGKLAK